MSTLNLGKDNLILDSDYSTEEKPTGATWIDGKPIYRKVFSQTCTFEVNIAGDRNIAIPHGISSFGELVNVFGYYKYNSYCYPLYYISGKAERNLGIALIDATNINLHYYNYASATSPVIIILEYTKTTD